MAASALESSLLKCSAKDYFFRAALCHLCVDSLNAQHAVQRYQEQYPAFGESREAKLIKVKFFSSRCHDYLLDDLYSRSIDMNKPHKTKFKSHLYSDVENLFLTFVATRKLSTFKRVPNMAFSYF